MMGRRMGRPGLLGTMARTAVIAGTATAVSGRVAGAQQSRAAAAQAQQNDALQSQAEVAEMQQQLAALQAQQAPAPVAAAPAAAHQFDLIAELQKLAALKDAGVLDESEFSAAKAKLLA